MNDECSFEDALLAEEYPVCWTLEQALEFVRKAEPIAAGQGYHIALTGGVLQRGLSRKDLDIVFYPRKTTVGGSPNAMLTVLRMTCGLEATLRTPYHKDDTKMVFCGKLKDKRRVDIFFMQ